MKTIPFVPFPLKTALKMSKSLTPFSIRLIKLFPQLDLWLSQSGTNIKPRDYLAIAMLASGFWFLIMFTLTFPLFVSFSAGIFSIGISFVISFVAFLTILYYPQLIVVKRLRDIDRNLFFALRHIIIHIKSGVSLFDSIQSVASANYGMLSVEFGKVVKEVRSGTPLTDSLENLIYRNPSVTLRRVVWHMVNSIKAGVDIGESISIMLRNLSDERMVEIRKYGSELNPLALMYMMFAVIIPTLGLTFLVVFSMFSGFQIQQELFYMFLIVLAVFQFGFIGIVKSKRPQVEI